jgi:hypothetical protein
MKTGARFSASEAAVYLNGLDVRSPDRQGRQLATAALGTHTVMAAGSMDARSLFFAFLGLPSSS